MAKGFIKLFCFVIKEEVTLDFEFTPKRGNGELRHKWVLAQHGGKLEACPRSLVKKFGNVEVCPRELLHSLLVQWMCREQQLESSNGKCRLMCWRTASILVHCCRMNLQLAAERSEAGKPWHRAVGTGLTALAHH